MIPDHPASQNASRLDPPPEPHLLRRCLAALAVAMLLLLVSYAADARAANAGPAGVRVSIACSSTGLDQKACTEGARAWAAETGNRVRIVSTPSSATARLALYQQFLAAGASDIDVYTVDVVWPGQLASYFIDLSPYVSARRRAAYAPTLLANDTVDGRLVALPWFADAGVLFYRRDLLDKYHLQVPQNWSDLTHAATVIQQGERQAGHRGFWGYVWQGRAYEGLTCSALEWIASYGGGIVAADGRVIIDDPKAAAALAMARSWVGTISPESVLNAGEEEARGIFQSGQAAFMRNWPYAWALAQGKGSPISGKVGVTRLPAGPGGRRAATLGGWQLAVSKFSAHKQQAASLALYLTSAAEQKRRAIAYGLNPTMPALYRDPEIRAAAPFLVRLQPAFAAAIARPAAVTKGHYNEVSAAFWTRVHAVLAGEAQPAEALHRLSLTLRRLAHGHRW